MENKYLTKGTDCSYKTLLYGKLFCLEIHSLLINYINFDFLIYETKNSAMSSKKKSRDSEGIPLVNINPEESEVEPYDVQQISRTSQEQYFTASHSMLRSDPQQRSFESRPNPRSLDPPGEHSTYDTLAEEVNDTPVSNAWMHYSDLDQLFYQLYVFYRKGGFACIIVDGLFQLLYIFS